MVAIRSLASAGERAKVMPVTKHTTRRFIYVLYMNSGRNQFVVPQTCYATSWANVQKLLDDKVKALGFTLDDLEFVGYPVPGDHLWRLIDGREFILSEQVTDTWE